MIKVKYSKREQDFLIQWKNDFSSNGSFINDHICDKSFIAELKNRGYDITTLHFSIKKLNEGKTAREICPECGSRVVRDYGKAFCINPVCEYQRQI